MDGIRYRDPKTSPGTADHDHEQPTLQLEKSDDYIPIHERKWKDIIPSAYSHKFK